MTRQAPRRPRALPLPLERTALPHHPPLQDARLPLRHLRAFLAVAEQGSEKRAGMTLYRAQSAVSRAVAKLEDELGVELFERGGRGMRLTRYGSALMTRARRAQGELTEARNKLLGPSAARRGRTAGIFGMLTHERRVRALIMLGDLHHMPTVARSIGVTQPAVSMAVREIEESVGIALFERTARGMIPTPAGTALILHLKRAFAEIRHAISDIEGLRGRMRGTVIVGALPLSRTRLLPEATAAIVAAHPELRVATVEGSFEALAASLRAGDLDFILGALRPPALTEGLEGTALAYDELVLAARCDHPLAARRRITPRDLAGVRWVLPRRPTPNRLLFERALAASGVGPPDVVVETSDLAVLRGILVNSDLVTAISARQLAYELGSGMLCELPFALPETRRMIGITRRAGALDWPGAKCLVDEIVRRAPRVLGARGE